MKSKQSNRQAEQIFPNESKEKNEKKTNNNFSIKIASREKLLNYIPSWIVYSKIWKGKNTSHCTKRNFRNRFSIETIFYRITSSMVETFLSIERKMKENLMWLKKFEKKYFIQWIAYNRPIKIGGEIAAIAIIDSVWHHSKWNFFFQSIHYTRL